jgi:hypothetical protein
MSSFPAVFICGLFNDAVSSSNYKASNARIIKEQWTGKDTSGSGRGKIWHYTVICLNELRKTKKKHLAGYQAQTGTWTSRIWSNETGLPTTPVTVRPADDEFGRACGVKKELAAIQKLNVTFIHNLLQGLSTFSTSKTAFTSVHRYAGRKIIKLRQQLTPIYQKVYLAYYYEQVHVLFNKFLSPQWDTGTPFVRANFQYQVSFLLLRFPHNPPTSSSVKHVPARYLTFLRHAGQWLTATVTAKYTWH